MNERTTNVIENKGSYGRLVKTVQEALTAAYATLSGSAYFRLTVPGRSSVGRRATSWYSFRALQLGPKGVGARDTSAEPHPLSVSHQRKDQPGGTLGRIPRSEMLCRVRWSKMEHA
jgi:hypothetical protein